MMDAEEASTIGARTQMIRRRRGLSQDVVAGLAGISKPYLSQLENGHRGFNRRGLVDDLADALGCSVADLTGQPYLTADRGTADAMAIVPGIELAIHDCSLDNVPDVHLRPLAQLVALSREANEHCDETRYALAGRDFGAVLAELHAYAATGDTDTRRAALTALMEACIAASGTVRGIGHGTLAAALAERDPSLTGFAVMQHAGTLTRLGARHRAAGLLGGMLVELEPDTDPTLPDNAPAQAAGMLHLASAQLASRERRDDDADTHLAQARELATGTGERNSLNYHFGPSSVAAWAVSIGVELERGPVAAERVTANEPRMTAVLASAERRFGLHLDLARVWTQAEGDRDSEAIRHLDTADRIAPTRVRNDPIARDLAITLDRRARYRVWELDSLLNRCGIGARR